MTMTMPRGIALPHDIDNVMCHTRDLTRDNFFAKIAKK